MKSKKLIVAAFSAFIFIISFVVYYNNNDSVYANLNRSLLIKSDMEYLSENCRNVGVVFCEFEKIANNAKKGEIESVILSMEKLENKDNLSNSYPIDCHAFAHTIGKIFFYHIGLESAISKKSICAAGIYHGAFEEWGTNSNIETVKREIPFLCQSKDISTAAYRLCIHGTGRALYRSFNNLKVGVDACSEAFKNEEDKQECFTGVLSSHFLIELVKKNELKVEYINKLLFDCLEINEKYQSTCISISVMEFLKHKYLFRMPIKDIDQLLTELYKYVEICENLNSPKKGACANGIGNSTVELVAGFESKLYNGEQSQNMGSGDKRVFTVVNKDSILKSMRVCSNFEGGLLDSCVNGAATWVLGRLGDPNLADEICSITKFNPVCINLKSNNFTYSN